MIHLESISNGLGQQSMYLMVLARDGRIPATVSISADTGWELDRKWSTGERSTTEEYYNQVVVPLGKKWGIETRFVRSEFKDKSKFPPLIQHVRECAEKGKIPNIPMYGSRGGQSRQVCTDKWKIRALRQEARRLGAKTNCNAQGIHFGEADRRIKGPFLREQNGWSIYQTVVEKSERINGVRVKRLVPVKWQTHYYPLVDLKMKRDQVTVAMLKENIPFLHSSECDGCPHKDFQRWERTSPSVVDELAKVEAMFNGELFFTDRRIPLKEAIANMQAEERVNPGRFNRDTDFGCGNSICGV
jgi:hypothetical protein